MKKLMIIGVAVGIASLAQAASITLPTGDQIVGTESYVYLINSASGLGAGTQITSASLTFNNIELTASGDVPNVLFYDLINGDYATQTINSGETSGDYFQNNAPYKNAGVTVALGSTDFTLDKTVSWTYTFTGTALADLEADALNGYFDIGLDPNCYYSIGSVVLNYSVSGGSVTRTPDSGMTVVLLGISLLGLMVFSRKFAAVKA
jgi:hypothetical protein